MKTQRPSWGDIVRVVDAPLPHIPRGLATVCGMGTVEHASVALERGWPVGTPFLTLEFGDGTTVELPESYVEVVERANG